MRTWTRGLGLSLVTVLALGCGDSDAPSAADDAGSGGDGDGDGDVNVVVDLDGGSATLGPTAEVRVANTVQGVSFDAWVRDQDDRAVRVAESLTFGSISEYFEVPLNAFSHHPEFVLLPSGQLPTGGNWSVVSGPDRAAVTVGELDGAQQRASLIVSLDNDTNQVAYATLDESRLMEGDPKLANLHIYYGLFDIDGGIVADLGIVGSGCFHAGSTNVADVFSVTPGSFAFGVCDSQLTAGCPSTTLLSAVTLTMGPGENQLVVTYLENTYVRLMAAHIAPPSG
ncbi:MAG: hypothetical protein QM778_31545 [Myxococcales bacterium]